MKKILLLLTALALAGTMSAKEWVYTLTSPDGRLTTHITTGDGGVTYDVVYRGVTLLMPSHIGLNYTQGDDRAPQLKTANAQFAKVTESRRTIDETVASPFTRQAAMRNHCNELTLKLKEGLSIIFRAYNEGVAYRFRWEGKAGKVISEEARFSFAGDYTATAPYVSRFDSTRHESQYFSSFENQYTTLPLSRLDPRRLCFLPLLVHGPNGVKICLTESTLIDYPGMYLRGGGDGVLYGEQAPLPKEVEQGGHNNLQLLVKERESHIAEMDKEKLFPWRIIMVAENSVALAMNNMSYLLGEASKVNDISWIKPGKVAWEWWNCFNITGVDFEAGVNNDTYKHYIDFASRYGIEYVILDEGWAVNKQADLFQVVPEIDLPLLVEYGRERGVGIILWAGYYAFDRDMEHVCKHYSEMGVKGFKIDFMDRDDQLVTDFYRRAAATCAKYHLVVDFHGAFKPAGLNRTYPNVLNFEGVFGLEQMKWAPATIDQMKYDTEIPFIRQAAGPMDYTQGAMLNGGKWNYHPCWMEPMSQGTRCHQLALYIVLESPLNMLCDSPTHYKKEPEYTRFVAEIPTVWDETRVLQGEVGEYIVTARRKGNVWYIGGITNWTPRDIEVDLRTLVDGNQPLPSVELYLDGINAHRKGDDYRHMTLLPPVDRYLDGINAHRKGDDYRHETLKPQTSVMTVHLAPGGGFVAKVGD